MSATIGRVGLAGQLERFGAQMTLYMELQELVFALLDFGLCLDLLFLWYPIPPFGMGMFTLCHCVVKVNNLILILLGLTVKKLP